MIDITEQDVASKIEFRKKQLELMELDIKNKNCYYNNKISIMNIVSKSACEVSNAISKIASLYSENNDLSD